MGKETRHFFPDEAVSPAGKPGFLAAHFFVLHKVHYLYHSELEIFKFL